MISKRKYSSVLFWYIDQIGSVVCLRDWPTSDTTKFCYYSSMICCLTVSGYGHVQKQLGPLVQLLVVEVSSAILVAVRPAPYDNMGTTDRLHNSWLQESQLILSSYRKTPLQHFQLENVYWHCEVKHLVIILNTLTCRPSFWSWVIRPILMTRKGF